MFLYMLSFECSPSKIFGENGKTKTKNTPNLGTKKNTRRESKIKDIILTIIFKYYARFFLFLYRSSMVRYFNTINSVSDNSATDTVSSTSSRLKTIKRTQEKRITIRKKQKPHRPKKNKE